MDVNLENVNKMLETANARIRQCVCDIGQRYPRIKWKSVSIVIPMKPKPSQRPRLSGYRIYVPHAAKNAAFFDKNVLPTLKGLFIDTPCKVKLDIYVETPATYTKTRKCLAEMKYLRPWSSGGDVDNYEKAVYDMIQPNAKRGHTGALMNDSLIIENQTRKYYSVTPRYELTITYMTNIPNDLIKKLNIGYIDIDEETE